MQSPALAVAAAERAFAADASARTVHEAFLAAFADDVVLFRPTPVEGHAALAQRAMNPKLMLLWTPVYAETSSDGTLGFDTGPSDFGMRGGAVAGHGWFVSMWRRTPNGWKLALDCGIQSPDAVNLDSAAHTTAVRTHMRSFEDAKDLMTVERGLIADYAAHFAQLADADVRAYRDNSMPATTRATAIALIQRDSATQYTPVKAIVAGSGDLGYVYGNTAAGGYLRIYRRRDAGDWKLAVDWRN